MSIEQRTRETGDTTNTKNKVVDRRTYDDMETGGEIIKQDSENTEGVYLIPLNGQVEKRRCRENMERGMKIKDMIVGYRFHIKFQ